MPKYENYKCPVCNQQFSNDDDIVTCPECGTPHHRECYNLSGHCVNRGLHSTGYSFIEDNKPIVEPKESQGTTNGIYYIPANNQAQAENNADNANDEENKSTKGFSPFEPIQFSTQEYKENGEIDGIAINDIAATIRTNIPRFITKFKSKSKLGWNWGAFFFGSFYLLFRKMYKYGISLFCLTVAIVFAGETAVLKYAPKYVEALQGLATNTDPSAIKPADLEALINIADAKNALLIAYIIIGILLIFRVITALLADSFYKKTVFEIINNVTEQLNEGANFTQTSMFMGQMNNLDQKQMKRLYLGNKGGVTLFAPFLAYFALYVITSFI